MKSQHEKLEKQSLSVQARLTNLQRKQDFVQRQREADLPLPMAVPKSKAQPDLQGEEKEKERPKSTKSQKVGIIFYCDFDLSILYKETNKYIFEIL